MAFMPSAKNAPDTRTSRATILVAREKGTSYRDIRDSNGYSHGLIKNVIDWAPQNPEQVREEIAAVFGSGEPDPANAPTPSEMSRDLADKWMETLEETLEATLQKVREVKAAGASFTEIQTHQSFDTKGRKNGRTEITKLRTGPGEDLYRLAGALKVIGDQAPKIQALLKGTALPAVDRPTVQVNVSQSMTQDQASLQVGTKDILDAEDHLAGLPPAKRIELLGLLGHLPEDVVDVAPE